jgi:diazepam-binding inhibitor (GABA receptor modulator, acyl-CoA-binding protein)
VTMAETTTNGEAFLKAAEYLRVLPAEIQMSNDQKLRSYGLFKQATVGDVNTERPGFFNQVNRAKWYTSSKPPADK